jgi:curved DNA-binding protein CbpA
MILNQPFEEARKVLGIDEQADAGALKRAYRKATIDNPPDRAPEQFRRIRDAYELLSAPIKAAEDILAKPVPWTPLPKLPAILVGGQDSRLADELLRRIVGSLPSESFPSPTPAIDKKQGKSKADE